MAKGKKAKAVTLEEALVPEAKWPYQVPRNWVWVRLGTVNSYQGISCDPSKNANDTFELYSVPIFETNYPEVVMGSEIGSTKQSVAKNDVLLCKINPRINRVWRVSRHTDFPLVASSEWIVIRTQAMDSKYLQYCLSSHYFRELLLSNVSGVGGSLMRAQPKYVKTYPVPLPPLPEQHRIVARIESLFEKLDRARELVQSALDSFETRKAAILHKAFTGELTAQWRAANPTIQNTTMESVASYAAQLPNKERRFIEEFQRDVKETIIGGTHKWYICTVGAIAVVTNGSTPSRKRDDYWNGNIPWVSSGEVRNNIIRSTRERITQEGFNNSSVKMLPEGTVLIAMIGEGKTRGQSAVLEISSTINQNVAAIIINHGHIDPHFLWYWLQKEYTHTREKGNGSGPQALNCQRVRELDFVAPSLSEQQAIVRILDDTIAKEESAQETLTAILDQIDLLKKSILARAFRGELGTNDPSGESAAPLLEEILATK